MDLGARAVPNGPILAASAATLLASLLLPLLLTLDRSQGSNEDNFL